MSGKVNYKKPSDPPKLAFIREAECIGCTKCISACPFDSIIGAPKLMHTVITDLCTGCELCVPPCPVDCIDIVSAPEKSADQKIEFEKKAKKRFDLHHARLEKERVRDREKYLQAKQAGQKNKTIDERKAEIKAALSRVKK